jgi:hypothetical protein
MAHLNGIPVRIEPVGAAAQPEALEPVAVAATV